MSKESVAVKTLLAVFVTAVALAAVATGLSWLLEKHPEACGPLASPRAAISRGERVGGPQRLTAPPAATEASHPDAAPSSLAAEVRERWRAVGERESELLARQEAITFIHADILAEKAAIQEVRQRVEDELSRAGLRQPSRDSEPRSDTQPQDGSMNDSAAAGGAQSDSLSPVANPPNADRAVALIQRLADHGNVETAVKLLSAMNERLAAKILTAISDPHPDLAARLIETLQHRKQQATVPPVVTNDSLRG